MQYSPYRMHQRHPHFPIRPCAAHGRRGGRGLASGLFDTLVFYDALAAVVLGRAGDDKRFVFHSYEQLQIERFLSSKRLEIPVPVWSAEHLPNQSTCHTEPPFNEER